MGQKQLHRWHMMKMAEVGKITLKEAGEKLGVSYRQAKRIRRAIRDRGMKGLIHGNRGRPSHRGHPDSGVLRVRADLLGRQRLLQRCAVHRGPVRLSVLVDSVVRALPELVAQRGSGGRRPPFQQGVS